jgi:hypothetical protein
MAETSTLVLGEASTFSMGRAPRKGEATTFVSAEAVVTAWSGDAKGAAAAFRSGGAADDDADVDVAAVLAAVTTPAAAGVGREGQRGLAMVFGAIDWSYGGD